MRGTTMETKEPKKLKKPGKESVYSLLKKPFPLDAYQIKENVSYNPVTLKAQYAIDRMNDVLGPGGWTHKVDFREMEDGSVVAFGTLKAHIDGTEVYRYAEGSSAKMRAPGDTYKSARTDCFKKCASMLGVGDSLFKGELNHLVDEIRLRNERYIATPTQKQRLAEVTSNKEKLGDVFKDFKGNMFDALKLAKEIK